MKKSSKKEMKGEEEKVPQKSKKRGNSANVTKTE